VRELIQQNTDPADLGILGDPGVNVLRLNLALDAIATGDRRTAMAGLR
jgi:K+-transporting ATPase ATPase C chain